MAVKFDARTEDFRAFGLKFLNIDDVELKLE
jgi:hypothetical protein